MHYFSYDPLGEGITFHDTKDEASAAAETALDAARDCAVSEEEWPDETSWICWGRIAEAATLTKDEPAPEGSGFDRILDFELKAVGPERKP